MANYAKVNEDNIVERVIVTPNTVEDGIDYIKNRLKLPGLWIQTSYNSRIRNKMAAIGDFYDEIDDVFYAPQPYPSWILDKENGYIWKAPVDLPNQEDVFVWDEDTLTWVAFDAVQHYTSYPFEMPVRPEPKLEV